MASKVPARMVLFSILVVTIQLSSITVQSLPVQNEIPQRNLRYQRSILTRDRESLPDYQPLCQSTTHRVDLHEPGYEFRPPFYNAVECKRGVHKHPFYFSNSENSHICLRSGLSCVQRSKTIQIAKRKIGTTCWTLVHKEVQSGCECMWPVHSNGDSRHHLA